MIDQVFGETTSFFGQVLSVLLRLLLGAAALTLRLALPIVLFVIVLLCKGTILCVILLAITFVTYWSNLNILRARVHTTRGFRNICREISCYGFADENDLRFQNVPFSVVMAVRNTMFYRRFIAFVDSQSTDSITIQNLMSLGWIATVLDYGLTHVIKLAVPLAITLSNIFIAPACLVWAHFA